TLPPFREILFGDGLPIEFRLQHILAFRLFIEPLQQRRTKLSIPHPPIQLFADFIRQPRNLSIPCHTRPPRSRSRSRIRFSVFNFMLPPSQSSPSSLKR